MVDGCSSWGVFGATEFLPARRSSSDAFGRLCAAVPAACVDVLEAICGADDENFNLTRLPEYFVNTPAGEGPDSSWVDKVGWPLLSLPLVLRSVPSPAARTCWVMRRCVDRTKKRRVRMPADIRIYASEGIHCQGDVGSLVTLRQSWCC